VMRYSDIVFCLYELCHSHTKENVLLNFLCKKKNGELNEFVQNIVGRNGLLVLCTTSYEKFTKMVQLKGKPAVDAHGLSECSGISRFYAVNRTMYRTSKILAKSKSYLFHLLHCSVV